MSAVADPPKLLTAEEYAALPEDGRFTELVRGEVVEMPRPNFRHGVVCNRLGRVLGDHVDARGLGWVLNNDSGILTERAPDTLRGADVAFFSYQRVPKDNPPECYPDAVPELVFEVMSPSDRWREVSAKVDEYLAAGVSLVVVVDPEREQAMLFRKGELGTLFGPSDELIFPGVLPALRISVRPLFA